MNKKVYIKDFSISFPKKKENNSQILKLAKKKPIEINNMIKKIGIKSRFISSKFETANSIAIKSAKKILRYYNKSKIDFLILCTNSPDYILPPNSCLLQSKLKLKKTTGSFDINLSCSGYIYALSIAKGLIQSNQAYNILLITSDTYSKFINKKDYKNRVIFGDAATATIISSEKKNAIFNLEKSVMGTDGSGGNKLIFKNFGAKYLKEKKIEKLEMDGPKIFEFALQEIPQAINLFLKKNNLTIHKIDYFVFHQANDFIVKNLALKLKLNNEKILMSMENTGNTVSSTIPIVLMKKKKFIEKNKKILLIGFGGGLSWGIQLIKKI